MASGTRSGMIYARQVRPPRRHIAAGEFSVCLALRSLWDSSQLIRDTRRSNALGWRSVATDVVAQTHCICISCATKRNRTQEEQERKRKRERGKFPCLWTCHQEDNDHVSPRSSSVHHQHRFLFRWNTHFSLERLKKYTWCPQTKAHLFPKNGYALLVMSYGLYDVHGQIVASQIDSIILCSFISLALTGIILLSRIINAPYHCFKVWHFSQAGIHIFIKLIRLLQCNIYMLECTWRNKNSYEKWSSLLRLEP